MIIAFSFWFVLLVCSPTECTVFSNFCSLKQKAIKNPSAVGSHNLVAQSPEEK